MRKIFIEKSFVAVDQKALIDFLSICEEQLSSKLEYDIDYRDNDGFSKKQLDELEKLLNKTTLSEIRGVSFSHWLNGNHLRFNIDLGLYGNIKLSGELSSDEKVSFLKESFGKTFKLSTWNYIFQYPQKLILDIASIIFLISILSICKVSGTLLKLYYYSLPFWFLYLSFSNYFQGKYPSIILFRENEKSSRSFKKDLWKFILAIIIPILINLATKYI